MVENLGVVPDEATKPLPGDELIPDAQASDTRGITIEASPDLVWPWLVQMGYGRGGWYSVDQLDMRAKSADRIVEEWQALAVGDVLPTHPGGGFQVKLLDPNRSLVLYGDPSTMQPPAESELKEMPAGLAASSTFLAQTPNEFKASWAFVLEAVGPGRTRLIERMRYWGGEGTPVSRAALSMLGFGAFVMMQRQMIGIRVASRAARDRGGAAPAGRCQNCGQRPRAGGAGDRPGRRRDQLTIAPRGLRRS